MMALDKWIATLFLIVSMAYGYSAFSYQLLPFEKFMVFLPNTMPNALAIIAGALSLLIILTPAQSTTDDDTVDDSESDATLLKDFEIKQAVSLVIAMIVYAVSLRSIGFLLSTALFLIVTGWLLGERKLHIMVPVALISSVGVWYLVQEALGLFLRPLPWFLTSF